MNRNLILFFSCILIGGCSILGVHFKIHNPHRAGKYPKKTVARTLLGNQESKFRTCFDVQWYNLNVVFGNDLSKDHSITGDCEIKILAISDFDTLQLDLAKNMKITNCGINDLSGPKTSLGYFNYSDANYFRKEGAVFVCMPHHIHAGQSIFIEIAYAGEPTEAKRPPWKGGFVRKKDKLDQPWWGVACETEGASSWWPCKDVMNDEPDSVDIRYTVSSKWSAISNGKLVDVSENVKDPGESMIWHWHVSYPINIYDITFYIGHFKLLHDTYYSEVTHDTLQLNHYVLEQNYDVAKTHFQQLKKYLVFYETTFGPYPWYRDGFKLVESPYAGMEHQSAIAYGNGYHDDPRNGFDYIILHETAHEWWGNSVTANDLADGWLHEGFATYTEALYVESIKGHDAYVNYLLQYRLFIINRRPIVGEKGIRYFDYRDGDIYMKGAWVLHSLRYAIANDSLFFDIIHSFYMENRYSTISSDKLEELVNRKTGQDYHWFFEQYLYNRFTPELEYCVKDGSVYYRWAKTAHQKFFMKPKIYFSGTTYFSTEQAYADPVQSKALPTGSTGVTFNTSEFLYKVVENKELYGMYFPKTKKKSTNRSY
ncbi:M1 family metallopeptidase [soil metagenome]